MKTEKKLEAFFKIVNTSQNKVKDIADFYDVPEKLWYGSRDVRMGDHIKISKFETTYYKVHKLLDDLEHVSCFGFRDGKLVSYDEYLDDISRPLTYRLLRRFLFHDKRWDYVTCSKDMFNYEGFLMNKIETIMRKNS